MMQATDRWDPERYLVYSDERGRPFVELVRRIGATRPASVVDLGCGPGNLTALLKQRWPDAVVTGVDSSPEMVEAARRDLVDARADFVVEDVRTWRPTEPVDVLISNATLQWVPDHLDLLPRLVEQVRPGGWFAFQVPATSTSRAIRSDGSLRPGSPTPNTPREPLRPVPSLRRSTSTR